jgi:hypothetical protein
MWCAEGVCLGKRNREGIKVARTKTPSWANHEGECSVANIHVHIT